MPATAPALLDSLGALSDPTRCRMLLAVERHELTVGELADVLQLPQSTVSRHLKVLSDTGWVGSRRDGTSRFYSLDPRAASGGIEPGALGTVWALARQQVADRPGAAQDQRRLKPVLARRASRSQTFFASSAGQWDRLREDLFGGDFFLRGLMGLADDRWTVGDLGCGTGIVSASIAPFVSRVIAIDASDEMLTAARARLDDATNVELRNGVLESLPIDAASLDAATMMLVLHHVPDPGAALAEASRVLQPGGRLVIVDMLPHDREEYKQQMGHVWLGFGGEHMAKLLEGAGFEGIRVHALPAASAAKGPALFVATARRRDSETVILNS
ncbi:MAG: metalloregulator ArsR/SmtB family transcription factor [Acidobacteriota bacterium]|nr:metalloregulator ArsR/SmtB family transcription factor [Acidobacteriota bacterium]